MDNDFCIFQQLSIQYHHIWCRITFPSIDKAILSLRDNAQNVTFDRLSVEPKCQSIGSKKKFRPLTRSRRKDGYFLRKITGSERKETCYKKRMLDHVDAWPNQEEIPSIKIIFIAKTLSVITE